MCLSKVTNGGKISVMPSEIPLLQELHLGGRRRDPWKDQSEAEKPQGRKRNRKELTVDLLPTETCKPVEGFLFQPILSFLPLEDLVWNLL